MRTNFPFIFGVYDASLDILLQKYCLLSNRVRQNVTILWSAGVSEHMSYISSFCEKCAFKVYKRKIIGNVYFACKRQPALQRNRTMFLPSSVHVSKRQMLYKYTQALYPMPPQQRILSNVVFVVSKDRIS